MAPSSSLPPLHSHLPNGCPPVTVGRRAATGRNRSSRSDRRRPRQQSRPRCLCHDEPIIIAFPWTASASPVRPVSRLSRLGQQWGTLASALSASSQQEKSVNFGSIASKQRAATSEQPAAAASLLHHPPGPHRHAATRAHRHSPLSLPGALGLFLKFGLRHQRDEPSPSVPSSPSSPLLLRPTHQRANHNNAVRSLGQAEQSVPARL